MERIPEFVTNHPLMFVALAVTVTMILVLEVQRARRTAEPLSPARATRLSNNEDAVFIDTRKQKEFEQGHVPGARCIPAREVEGHLKQVEKLREHPVILYDDGALDAERAAKELAKNGFARLYAIDGGLPAWRKAELPVETGSGPRKAGSGGQKKKKKQQKDERAKT